MGLFNWGRKELTQAKVSQNITRGYDAEYDAEAKVRAKFEARKQISNIESMLNRIESRRQKDDEERNTDAAKTRRGEYLYTITYPDKPNVIVEADYCAPPNSYCDCYTLGKHGASPIAQSEAFIPARDSVSITRKKNPAFKKVHP